MPILNSDCTLPFSWKASFFHRASTSDGTENQFDFTRGVESAGTYKAEEETMGLDNNEEKPDEPDGSDEEDCHVQSSHNNSKEGRRVHESCQNQ